MDLIEDADAGETQLLKNQNTMVGGPTISDINTMTFQQVLDALKTLDGVYPLTGLGDKLEYLAIRHEQVSTRLASKTEQAAAQRDKLGGLDFLDLSTDIDLLNMTLEQYEAKVKEVSTDLVDLDAQISETQRQIEQLR